MNFSRNFVVYIWILSLTKYRLLTDANECVRRRLGFCKVWKVEPNPKTISLADFQSPQPEGFALKTSIEINLLSNKHSYENNVLLERKRPIRYNLDNAALVTIEIGLGYYSSIKIHLGKKHYRVAELEHYNYESKLRKRIYNRYTPILPTFPYNLHFEITTNGTVSVSADANTEPFLKYQLSKRPSIKFLEIRAPPSQTDLIVFVDCSSNHCGSYRIDRLYGCREWFVQETGRLFSLKGFQKTYKPDVLFDEFVVVDTEYSSKMRFWFSLNFLEVDFKVNSIEATLNTYKHQMIKRVQTKQWFEVPESPYAIQILITKGENDNILKISNIRGYTILTFSLCGENGILVALEINDPKVYLDCIHPDYAIKNVRHRKSDKRYSDGISYHENDGFNFTKSLLDTRQFLCEPFVFYENKFGNNTDSCESKPIFPVMEKSEDLLHAVIESSNEALLSELRQIRNATATTNKVISDYNTDILGELKKIGSQNIASLNTSVSLPTELENGKAWSATHSDRNSTN